MSLYIYKPGGTKTPRLYSRPNISSSRAFHLLRGLINYSTMLIKNLLITSLPQEIQDLIASNLLYPDALALKHTNQHFYNTVNTDIRLKVAWLISRTAANLPCPMRWHFHFDTDELFCANKEVRAYMLLRRRHIECPVKPQGTV